LLAEKTKQETSIGLLKFFFIMHFFVDVIVAIPLFLCPVFFLTKLGWQIVDPVAARLVAAALFGIGIESYLGRKASKDTFISMLNLKIIWSFAAVIGLGLSMLQNAQGSPLALQVMFIIFLAFHLLWVYWRFHLGELLKKIT